MTRIRPTHLTVILLFAGLAACNRNRPVAPKSEAQHLAEAQGIVTGYRDAGLAGDNKAASDFCEYGVAAGKYADDMTAVIGAEGMELVETYRADRYILGVTTQLGDARHSRGLGRVIFSMVALNNGEWKIRDVNFEDEEGVDAHIARFMEAYPRAKRIQ